MVYIFGIKRLWCLLAIFLKFHGLTKLFQAPNARQKRLLQELIRNPSKLRFLLRLLGSNILETSQILIEVDLVDAYLAIQYLGLIEEVEYGVVLLLASRCQFLIFSMDWSLLLRLTTFNQTDLILALKRLMPSHLLLILYLHFLILFVLLWQLLICWRCRLFLDDALSGARDFIVDVSPRLYLLLLLRRLLIRLDWLAESGQHFLALMAKCSTFNICCQTFSRDYSRYFAIIAHCSRCSIDRLILAPRRYCWNNIGRACIR